MDKSELRLLALRYANGELDRERYLFLRSALIDDITHGRKPIVRDPADLALISGPDTDFPPGRVRAPRQRLRLLGVILGVASVLATGTWVWSERPATASANKGTPSHTAKQAVVAGPSRNSTQPATTVMSAPALGPPPATQNMARLPANTLPTTSSDWFRAQPTYAFTVQVLTSPDKDHAFRLTEGFPELEFKIQRSHTTPHLYRVVHGSFGSRELAEQASDALPESLLGGSDPPLIRRFTALRGQHMTE